MIPEVGVQAMVVKGRFKVVILVMLCSGFGLLGDFLKTLKALLQGLVHLDGDLREDSRSDPVLLQSRLVLA